MIQGSDDHCCLDLPLNPITQLQQPPFTCTFYFLRAYPHTLTPAVPVRAWRSGTRYYLDSYSVAPTELSRLIILFITTI